MAVAQGPASCFGHQCCGWFTADLLVMLVCARLLQGMETLTWSNREALLA